MTFTERDYQTSCRQLCHGEHQHHNSIVCELPTGTGKTVIFSRYASEFKGGRKLVICPFITLVPQAASKLQKETGVYPDIEQGSRHSVEHPEMRNEFVVASRDSLYSRDRYKRIRDVSLVIVDEAHLFGTHRAKALLNHFVDDGAKVLGFSAI